MNLSKCGKCGQAVLKVAVAPIVPAGQYGMVMQHGHMMDGQRVYVRIASSSTQYVSGVHPHGGWWTGPVERVQPIGEYTPEYVWYDNTLSDVCGWDDGDHDPDYDGAPLTQEEVTTPAEVYRESLIGGPYTNGVNQ